MVWPREPRCRKSDIYNYKLLQVAIHDFSLMIFRCKCDLNANEIKTYADNFFCKLIKV